MNFARGPPIDQLWLWRAGPGIYIDVGALFGWIGTIKKRKTRKGTTVQSFCLELHRILWTVCTTSLQSRTAQLTARRWCTGVDAEEPDPCGVLQWTSVLEHLRGLQTTAANPQPSIQSYRPRRQTASRFKLEAKFTRTSRVVFDLL